MPILAEMALASLDGDIPIYRKLCRRDDTPGGDIGATVPTPIRSSTPMFRLRFHALVLPGLLLLLAGGSTARADLLVGSDGTNRVLRYDDTGAFLGVFASGGGLVAPGGLLFGPDTVPRKSLPDG